MTTETPPRDDDDAETLEPSSNATERLEAEIAVTRARVAEEVDTIAERISPAGIERQLKSSLQRRAAAIVQLAREHPLPAALLGLGLVFFVWKLRGRQA